MKNRKKRTRKVAERREEIHLSNYVNLSGKANRLKADPLATISGALKVSQADIRDVTDLKKGMTNHSLLFTCRNKKYIMRVPGEGTDQMIDRRAEAAVYQAIEGKHI